MQYNKLIRCLTAVALYGFSVSVSHAGLYKKLMFTNKSTPYTKISVPSEVTSVSAVLVNPLNERNIYIGSTGGLLYQTWDAGKEWRLTNKGIDSNTVIQRIWMAPSNGSSVYAVTKHGVYSSFDSGFSWRKYSTKFDTMTIQCSLVTESDSDLGVNLFIGTREGVFISKDEGETWVKLNEGLSSDDLNVTAMGYDPSDKNLWFIGTAEGSVYWMKGNIPWTLLNSSQPKKGAYSISALDVIVNINSNFVRLYFSTNKINPLNHTSLTIITLRNYITMLDPWVQDCDSKHLLDNQFLPVVHLVHDKKYEMLHFGVVLSYGKGVFALGGTKDICMLNQYNGGSGHDDSLTDLSVLALAEFTKASADGNDTETTMYFGTNQP